MSEELSSGLEWDRCSQKYGIHVYVSPREKAQDSAAPDCWEKTHSIN